MRCSLRVLFSAHNSHHPHPHQHCYLPLFPHPQDLCYLIPSDNDPPDLPKGKTPIAQMADIGFKVVLLERLNQKWKQKHF